MTRTPRLGWGTLTAGLVLAVAISGLLLLGREVEAFSLGTQSVDARSFPRWVLFALAGLAALRLVVGLSRPGVSIGSPGPVFRVGFVAMSMMLGLLAMVHSGFLVGAAIAGAGTSLAFGGRRLWINLGIAAAVAGIVTLCARELLGIPLP